MSGFKNKENKNKKDNKILNVIKLRYEIIKNVKNHLEVSKLELMYKILLYIDKDKIPKHFFHFVKILKN